MRSAAIGGCRCISFARVFPETSQHSRSVYKRAVDHTGRGREAELLNGNLIVNMEFTSPDVISPVIPGLILDDEGGYPIYGSNPAEFIRRGLLCEVLAEEAIRFEANDLPDRGRHLPYLAVARRLASGLR